MNILLVGGDSAEVFRKRSGGRKSRVEHWTGRKHRDLVRSIPKATEAVVVVLDRVSHTLARKVRGEASRRGLPVYFLKRGRQMDVDARSESVCFDSRRYRELSVNG
ncbi:MAG: DUF2325 domain-containing protein [Nitrospira sp.]|jgi:hypothetical protein|nr:DUF2325 domain-containing protein [Nitrospira sp. BO4]